MNPGTLPCTVDAIVDVITKLLYDVLSTKKHQYNDSWDCYVDARIRGIFQFENFYRILQCIFIILS
jgi:hypothetical protein